MRKKILVVDDEDSVRLSLGFWLRRNDFYVTLCGTAGEARAALRREPFDWVISDLRLTRWGREGIDLLEEALDCNPAAHCILFTASPPDDLPPSLGGAASYVVCHKPVDVFELLDLLGGPQAALPERPR